MQQGLATYDERRCNDMMLRGRRHDLGPHRWGARL